MAAFGSVGQDLPVPSSSSSESGPRRVLDGRREFHPTTVKQWRSWLAKHQDDGEGVWLISWKKSSGKPAMTYDESVDEAIAFGWVDSLTRSLDEERSMLWFAPRKEKSSWSRVNKDRVDRLIAQGRMMPRGMALVGAAKASGTWNALDEVENLTEPVDLAAALDANPSARAAWDGFPRSAKRAILEWISLAKKPATRQQRIETTVREAQEGRRANQWQQTKGAAQA
jgi:uncharacterized protein YdeI (YjbR/CyaY-like superfamily)